MRIAIVMSVLAACSPDIASGDYRCGPDSACPGDQQCNGSDNTCVFGVPQPFACLPKEEHEPDDTPDVATDMGAFGCVSNLYTFAGCLAAGDAQDWFKFTAPTGCTAIQANVHVTYPIAFETVGIEFGDAAGTRMATDAPCAQTGGLADDDRCITQTLTGGATYTVKVKPAGGGDCNGKCNYNRYTLTLQVTTPG